MKSVESIALEALLLPKDQRLTLAHRILSSVEPQVDPEAEGAWDDEIRDRIKKYDAGQALTVAAQEVLGL
jgi:hypothetical protein